MEMRHTCLVGWRPYDVCEACEEERVSSWHVRDEEGGRVASARARVEAARLALEQEEAALAEALARRTVSDELEATRGLLYQALRERREMEWAWVDARTALGLPATFKRPAEQVGEVLDAIRDLSARSVEGFF